MSSAAARTLAIAQPTVSKRVRDLETAPQVQIAGRNSRGIVPTPADRTFHGRAQAAAGEADIAIQRIVEPLAVPAADRVGPLPDAIRKAPTTSAAVMCPPTRAADARTLLRFLTAPANADTCRAKGLELAAL